jgi:hypothetical protein
MSYDASGFGIQLLTYANSTPVTNATAWVEAGYVLTYEMDSKYYLNVTGWDPLCQRGPFSASAHYIRHFISEHAYYMDFDEFIAEHLWKDWELPAPTANNYSVGIIFQGQGEYGVDHVMRYGPALVLDSNKLIIDWNGTKAFHDLWIEEGILELRNRSTTPGRAYYENVMDWSFKDDYDAGYYYTVDGTGKGPVLAADLDKDGMVDIGFGSLCWAYDDHKNYYTYYFNETLPGTAEEQLFCGFRTDGLGFAILTPNMYPSDVRHGTWCAGAAASRGVYNHTVYMQTDPENDTVYKLPGTARGAQVASANFFSWGGYVGTYLWFCGFHLDPVSGYWNYTGDGPSHKTDILSMSWGSNWNYNMDLYYNTMMWDLMTIPGLVDPLYPGTLLISSSGNNGPDYMTGTPPGVAAGVVSVGGMTTSHYYDNIYDEDQGWASDCFFASRGPGLTGWSKPDVVAPAYRGANPEDMIFHMYYSPEDGFTGTYRWWQGTSLSCPIAAGVAATIAGALKDNLWTDWNDPFLIKEILLSTATPILMDGFVSGHGSVNAANAVSAIDGNSTSAWFYHNTDSYDNYVDAIKDAWMKYLDNESWYDIYVEPDLATPGVGTVPHSTIYFGNVEPGETVMVNTTFTDFDGNDKSYAEIVAGMPTDLHFVYGDHESWMNTTWWYDDTGFDPAVERAGHINVDEILTNLGSTILDDYAYVSIHVTFDTADIGNMDIVRAFDWIDNGVGDQANNDLMNFYSIWRSPWGIDYEGGDYIRHLGRDYNTFNSDN